MLRRVLVSTPLILILATAPVMGQLAAHEELRDFQPNGEFQLLIDGAADPKAEIYQSDRAVAFLIWSRALESPVLLFPRSRSGGRLSESDLLTRPDGGIDIAAGSSTTPIGSFQLEGTEVVFEIDGHSARLVQKPPLLGWKTAEDLLQHSPEYARQRDAYSIQPGVLQLLKALSQGVDVKTYFGSWCPFCRSVVPFMLGVDRALAGLIAFGYYGLPHNIQSDSEAQRLEIRSVPTGVVYIGGKEVGRLQGNDWRDPALALYQILLKADVG